MKVSLNWISDFLDIKGLTDTELDHMLSFHVCELEDFYPMCTATNLTIGYVKECVAHPDSDHLHICQIEVKPGEVSQIVCGAPNMKQGAKVIVALPGAVLPEVTIKPSKVRGVESNGMCCSLQELGVEEKYVPEAFKDGIYLFNDDAPVGGDPLKYLGLDDKVVDFDLTSNRSDLLSIEGVCYDMAACLHQKFTPISPKYSESAKENDVNVTINTDLCYQYHVRKIENVKIGPSPMWMKARLVASGIRPINNVVDITNYVLMALGQPLHSFDGDKLGNNILVREAEDGETLKTLDGVERKLIKGDVVITDGKTPLCLAGVMGGASTEVTDSTTTIVLEAAEFDPLAIRRTSARVQLKSESSIRFERKIDSLRVVRALDYACELLEKYASGNVLKGMKSCETRTYEQKSVKVLKNKVNKVLGTSLTNAELEGIFDDLCYDYKVYDDYYLINLPSRRMDLEPSFQDICEDVARMYGYDNIPTTLCNTNAKGYLTYRQRRIRIIRNVLSHLGLNECVSYSLVSENDLYTYTLQDKDPIKVLMPMTEDRAVMRESLLNGVVEVLMYNQARKMEDLHFFEIGKRYTTTEEEYMLAGGMMGTFNESLWQGMKQPVDFYTLKGVVEALFAKLGEHVEFERAEGLKDTYHPGRSAYIKYNNEVIGIIAELHPRFAKEHDLKNTYVFEMNIEPLLVDNHKASTYSSINKFPSISRDLAIVVDKSIPSYEIEKIIKQTGKKLITSIELFDCYEGENVGENEKSLAYKLVFEDKTKTLTQEDVEKVVRSVLNRLDFNFKAKLRQ